MKMLKQLYMHFDGDSCVYVGMGSPGRAYSVYNRQKDHLEWCERQLTHSKDYVKIMITTQDIDAVAQLEKDLINELAPIFNKVYNPNHVFCSHSTESRNKISRSTKKAMQGMHAGKANPTAKLADIYDFQTKEVVAENVVINLFCKEFGYNQGHLSKTARGEAPQHRGLYAKYKDNSH